MPALSMISTRWFSGATSDCSVVSNPKPSRADTTAMPWSPTLPDTRMTSPGCALVPETSTCGGSWPRPAVLMNSLSAPPFWTTLVSPAAMYTGLAGRLLHGSHDPAQDIDREPLLDDQSAGECQRSSPDHGKVVDSSADSQAANVTAREKQRGDYM